MSAYENLKARFEKITNIENALSMLQTDSAIFMPANSGKDREQQIVTLASISYDLLTTPEVGQWLAEAEAEKDTLSAPDRRNLELMRWKWVHKTAIPSEIAQEIPRLETEGQEHHNRLRPTGDWSQIRDWYAHCFEVMRTAGMLKKDPLGKGSAYDALLDMFSPGVSVADVEREFAVLENRLPGLIAAAVEKQKTEQEPIPLQGIFPRAQQEELCRRLAVALGFDFTRGRLDFPVGHPMTAGTPSDVRFISDIHEDDFLKAVGSTVHETGHALYQQNLPLDWRYQPAGEALGMAVHESMSRIIEVQACHTREFFEFLEREARAVFNRPDDPALTAENLQRHILKVEPSFIRIRSDAMTYPAHILLRFRIEKAVIDGSAMVDDIPHLWNEGMQSLLGITPPSHAQGCMQDVHWPVGLAGYFPAYTLGDMAAAQLFKCAEQQRPEIRAEIARGNFTPLREWLTENIYRKASLMTAEELLIQATGEKLNAQYYLDSLSRRYVGKPLAPQPEWHPPVTSPA